MIDSPMSSEPKESEIILKFLSGVELRDSIPNQ